MHLVFVMQAVPAVAVALQRLLIFVLRLLLLPVLAFASAAVVEAAAVLETAVQALSSLSLVAVPLVSSAVLL